MGLWRQALSTLVISANDVVSAECFCIQRGVPLNSFTLRRILDRLGVDVEQVNLNTPGSLAPPTSELLQLLIDILLNSQQPNSTPALTRFINAQSSHLEPLVVLDRIPEDVPLAGLAPFFVRALRRSNHKAFNTNVYKTLAASQTTAVGSQLYEM